MLLKKSESRILQGFFSYIYIFFMVAFLKANITHMYVCVGSWGSVEVAWLICFSKTLNEVSWTQLILYFGLMSH